MNKGHRAGESAIAVDVEQGKSYYWCSCGKSSKQPFCDCLLYTSPSPRDIPLSRMPSSA